MTDAALLQELALLAASRGQVGAAERLAAGLALLLPPGAPGPVIARALARLEAGERDAACALLHEAWRNAAPGEDRALLGGFLALALQLAGRALEVGRLALDPHPITAALQQRRNPLMEAFAA